MSSVVSSPAVVVAFATAIASLGAAMWANRKEIHRLKDWAWGNERERGDGHEGQVDGLDEKMGRIESKLDDERKQRRDDHEDVYRELKANRVLVLASVRGVVSSVNKEVDDVDIDPEDARPDFLTDELDVDVDPDFLEYSAGFRADGRRDDRDDDWHDERRDRRKSPSD